MCSEPVAIRVENLGKCYHIYDRPQDRLKQSIVPRLQRLLGRPPSRYAREFWALREVALTVHRGETMGIIGRNGSGKSTLLQIICGTLLPTGGKVEINGRVGALLELGAGFNPEFTGRENVYLNAALFGLSTKEIESRFGEIAAFAELDDFMDQPVKTYSSGMYVRLAFAVTISIEPDILIVDEALSVGDLHFQMKCLDRMEQIRARGTTILFVSHALEQVKRFCGRAAWLDQGRVRLIGEANFVSDRYRDHCLAGPAAPGSRPAGPALREEMPARVLGVEVSAAQPAPFEPFAVRVRYAVGKTPLPKLLLGVAIRDLKGTYIFGPNTHLDRALIPFTPGSHQVEYLIPKLPLLTGTFLVDVGLFTDGGLVCLDYIGSAAEVCVVAKYFSEGLVYIDHEWKTIIHG